MVYRILIVDDQKEVSRLLKSALETIEQGLDVAEAPSGEEALLDAKRKQVDLLVADFRLPGITGVELMKKFRALNPQIKIILITGISDPRLLREVQNAGADSFFQKPVSIGDFLDAVERHLGMARTILHKVEEKPAQQPPIAEVPDNSLGGVLVNLRKDLNAQAVILIDNLGHVQAEAGQLPDPNTTVSLISSLMGMFNAAQKVAGLLNHGGSHLHLFDSSDADGVFLPVGPTHALLVVGKDLANAKKLAERLERLFAARTQLHNALKTIGVPLEPVVIEEKPPQRSAIEEPFTQPENLANDFLDIFNQIGKKSADADSFWDTAVEKGTTYAEPDKLTYEQASKLGLAPD
jgi:CheY-like chemotaxis protein